jgi:hypothetical protein
VTLIGAVLVSLPILTISAFAPPAPPIEVVPRVEPRVPSGINPRGDFLNPSGRTKKAVFGFKKEIGGDGDSKRLTPFVDPHRDPSKWTSWRDLPPSVPDSGYVVSKDKATGDLSPERFPGIFFPKPKTVEATGPPRSLEILNKDDVYPRSKAIRAYLVGPGEKIVGSYKESPDGRYVLDLPSERSFEGGRYGIRIVVDGSERTIIRRISIITGSAPLGGFEGANQERLEVYLGKGKEVFDGGYAQATFETNAMVRSY